MDIRVLGPLSIQHAGASVTPIPAKPGTALALLLLNPMRVVPVPVLMDELWREAPRTARAALQIHVLQLRKKLARVTGMTLAEVSENVLQTVQNGYRFVVEQGQLDLQAYQRLQRTGTKAVDAGDYHLAAEDFRRALSLWRGPAVADVEAGTRIRAEAAALERSRMTMLDYRIELDLRLGLHRQILGELAVLASRDRFHENLHAQFVIALYRSGYRIRALEVFHQVRHNLRTEFGLEPSGKLKRLHQAILTQDPALDEAEVVPLPRGSAAELLEAPALASSF